jgi:hypothetical protein
MGEGRGRSRILPLFLSQANFLFIIPTAYGPSGITTTFKISFAQIRAFEKEVN